MKLKLLAVAVTAAISTPALAEVETKTKVGGGYTIKTSDAEFKVEGRVQYDFDWFDGDAFNANGDDSGSDSEIRRARISLKGKVGDWAGKVEADLDDDASTISEAYLQYKGWDFGDLTVGKHKAAFGLEEQTSSKDITAIERTMSTNAFAPGKLYGVSLGNAENNYTWNLGIYDNEGEEDDNMTTTIAGRATYAPIVTKNEVLHLGFGVNKTRLGSNEFKDADQRLDVHLATEKAGSGTIMGESLMAYNFEIAYANGPFHAQAEYFDGEIDEVKGSMTGDTDITGYYAQFGYVITGESRPYSKGKFKRVKPKGKSGAWEVFGRWSSYEPGEDEAEALTLGLNYYANNAVRVGLNYVMGDLEEDGQDKDGDALSLRFQYVF
ncbi:OprO/OprP family phosphate-selective porin [Kangiella sp. TOML190]|uniref:OprO/OprP family phosphate-selective porin n=1 Tax=Kangiella sp. TOML190 TaxID=2931351 RepID=UPI00204013E8|nr:porin [Kangiella sp. TOML190]